MLSLYCSQLKDDKVAKMETLLKRTQSSYYPAFVDMYKDVMEGKVFNALSDCSIRLYS